MSSRFVRSSASLASLFVVLAFAESAFAQDPAAPPAATPTAPAAAPVIVTPAPGQAAAAAPSRTPVAITATCTLGDHDGVADDEAHTAADVVCHELARQGATNTAHEVRFGKLGGKMLMTVASRNGNSYDERRTLLTGMDEVPVAAPRLAGALSDGRSLDDTKTVDNVLSSETRAAKVQQGQMGLDMGLFGMTSLGQGSGASGGIELGLLYRAGSVGVSALGRAGGIGSDNSKVGTASLDTGIRYYLSSSDFAPFVGAGIELAYFDLSRQSGSNVDGSGIGANALVGVEMLRTHHASFAASVRLDAPFFALRSGNESQYVMPLSFNVGILFH